MSNIAYVRVSQKNKDTDQHIRYFKEKGIKIRKTYVEVITNHTIASPRPQLDKLFEKVKAGDKLYVQNLKNLGCNIKDFLMIVEKLADKGIDLVIIEENIDTSTPAGKPLLDLFVALLNFERDVVKARQRAGIDLALASQKPYGRPAATMPKSFRATYKAWKAKKITATAAMKRDNLSKFRFYKFVKEIESKL